MDWFYHRGVFLDHAVTAAVKQMDSLEGLTPIERIAGAMLYFLRRYVGVLNMRVHPQVKIGKYTADFVVEYYEGDNIGSPTKKIVVECDGHDFHEKTKEQAAKDKQRDRYMQKEGFVVLRFTGSEIFNSPEKVVTDVAMILVPQKFQKRFPGMCE